MNVATCCSRRHHCQDDYIDMDNIEDNSSFSYGELGSFDERFVVKKKRRRRRRRGEGDQ
jgi:hypothetical protein